nr:hypothetical protein [Tanacetum cinerariifolium]
MFITIKGPASDLNLTTKLQPTDAEMGQNWYRRPREIVLENKVDSLEAKVEKLQLDHDKMVVFFENFKKIRPELVPPTPDAKEDPSDAAIDGEHMDVVGHPDENEGPNEKEDPSDVAIDGEHMDTIGSPDETKEPNAQEPISHVLNTQVDNGDVLITDAPDTINLSDPPSHESEITSPCGGCSSITEYRKGIASMAYIRRSKRHNQGMLSTADNGERRIVPDVTKPRDLKRNKKKGTLLQDFMPVIGKDGKEIQLEPWTEKPCYCFPWGTGFAVNDKLWQCLVAKDANRKGWLNDLVCITINIKNAHWFLAGFQIRTGVITFYDTLSGPES